MISNKRYFLISLNHLAVLIWFFAVVSVGRGQTKAPSDIPGPLPPEAQAAVEKGLSAAKQAEWIVAIRYFSEARRAAPDSPVPLVNLGLAEAQLPGRELRAICWFEAYLALAPNAANTPAVRKKIIDLDVRAEGNAQKMIGLLKGPAANFSDYKKHEAQGKIASLLVRIGDSDAANAILNQSSDDAKDGLRYQIVKALAESGHFIAAIKLAGELSDFYKSLGYKDIASGQIEAGLLSEVRQSLDKMSGIARLDDYLAVSFHLAEAEYQSGQQEQAATLLSDAQQSINKITTTSKYSNLNPQHEFLIPFAVAEYKTGQPQAARALLQQIRNSMGDLTSLISGSNSTIVSPYGERMRLLLELARAFHEIGQGEKSLQCLDEAAQAHIAGNAAHEINPYTITYMYIKLQDWDRAKAQALREATDDYNKRVWSKKEKEDFVASRIRDIANAKIALAYASAKATSIKTLADATASPARRAQAWCDYMNAAMNTPLFTDFTSTLEGLATHVSGEEDFYRDTSVFTNVEEQVEVLVSRLKDTRDLQAKQIKFAEK